MMKKQTIIQITIVAIILMIIGTVALLSVENTKNNMIVTGSIFNSQDQSNSTQVTPNYTYQPLPLPESYNTNSQS